MTSSESRVVNINRVARCSLRQQGVLHRALERLFA